MHLIYILYACEKKSKIFLYIEGMEMTVTDCHQRKDGVQKWNGKLMQRISSLTHTESFRFWERFANDQHCTEEGLCEEKR